MNVNAVLGMLSGGVCCWSLIAMGICRWVGAEDAAITAGQVAWGSLVLTGILWGAAAASKQGPWFECFVCHGNYQRHDVEQVGEQGYMCGACLMHDSPRDLSEAA